MFKKLNSPESYPILREAKLARFQPHFVAQLGIFVLIFVISQLIQAIPAAIAMFPSISESFFSELENGGMDISQIGATTENVMETAGDNVMLTMLFSTAFVILIIFIYCRKIEKRTFSSMGFSKTKFVKYYLLGLLIGAAMIAATILGNLLPGAIRFEVVDTIPVGYIVLFFFAFLVQGMSEEVMCRGYLMVSLSNRTSVLFAVLTNSLIFSLLHIFNPNITILSLFNIFLFGVLLSICMLLYNNIWVVSAIHSIWNFMEVNIFGSPVSGTVLENRLLTMLPDNKYGMLHGGLFGVEGGLSMTIVLCIAIVCFTFLLVRRVRTSRQV